MKSYISPKAEKVKNSPIHGIGLFAVEKINKGEVIAVKSGQILTKKQVEALDIDLHAELQIAEDLYITPTNEKEYDENMVCINHSCTPNAGVKGNIVWVALRDIEPKEEITMDYVIIDNDPTSAFDCSCGTAGCRGKVSGQDWKQKELQEKYKGYFTSYVQGLIETNAA